ncbi:uncharacterized protein LOC128552552 [Mercenaria mercenaria]|uniref:uncharacterized protein LOC128552552 n=1 Tax=Mercenaria mercenaria TaxID=6596 RepID=UPI00234F42E8|nr:uncharacterized protein LOC128552552 [Mercenaria mercenaria]
MAAKLDVSTPPQFIVTGQHANLAKQWEQYIKRFNYFIGAANITKDEQKRNLLLHVSGEQIQDIFETLPETGTSYNDAVTSLNQYFAPKKNVACERHIFRQAGQEQNETIDNFVVRLSKLAISCEFPETQKNDMIRDQIIEKCSSSALRRKLLQETELTLEKVQTKSELSALHTEKMTGNNNFTVNNIQTQTRRNSEYSSVKPNRQNIKPSRQTDRHLGKQYSAQTAVCYRCGNKGHYGKECRKSRNVMCSACSKSDTSQKCVKPKV